MAAPLKVCVCGGGKSAHVMTVLAAAQNADTKVLAIFEEEAKLWNRAISRNKMVLTIKGPGDTVRELKGKPDAISKRASDVVPGSDLILIVVDANGHADYLRAIIPHIDKKTAIVALPGQPGFEYQCRNMLGELAEQVTIMSFERSPWTSNIVEFGAKVEVTKISKNLRGSIIRGKAIPRKPALMSIQMLLGFDTALQQLKHFLEVQFIPQSFLKPAIIYSKWNNWDEKPVSEEPLFYEDVDEDAVAFIENCSKEYQQVAQAITEKAGKVNLSDVPDVLNWIKSFYGGDVADSANLQSAIKTNASFKEVTHEMVKEKTKFWPSFSCRALTEDIPYGVVVVKGIAEIVGVATPCLDTLITWAQDKLKKSYLVDGKLNGKNIAETRAPQVFGLQTLDEVISGLKAEAS